MRLKTRNILLGLILLLIPACLPATTVQVIGTISSNNGGINGQGCFQLPVNVIDTSTNRALSPQSTCFRLTNGTFPAFANIVPNDVMQPQSTYYKFTAYDTTGFPVFYANYYIITGGGTFNIGLALPTTVTTSNISYINPANLNTTNTWCCLQTFNGGIAGTTATFSGLGIFNSLQVTTTATIGTSLSINGGTVLTTTNQTGTGSLVLSTSPTITTPIINGASTGSGIQGTDSKLMTAGTVSGVSGDPLCLDANGGATTVTCTIGLNKYFSVSGCTTAASTDSNCTGTITLPVAYADASYIPMMTVNSVNGAFLAVSVSGSLAAGSFPYTLTCTFNCSSIVTPTIYVYTHHN